MGGRKFCPQEELTREVLLQYLKAKGGIREVDGLLDITVQTMTGKSFSVVLESGSSAQIGLLKSEIEEAEGTPACRQDLLVLREGEPAAEEEGRVVPLADGFVISESCTIALCVAVEPGQHALAQAYYLAFCIFLFRIANLVFSSFSFLLEWAWDATSDLIKQGIFALSGIDNSIATKIDKDGYNNCMMTGPVMEGTGKHTISMKVGNGDKDYMFTNLDGNAVVYSTKCKYASLDQI